MHAISHTIESGSYKPHSHRFSFHTHQSHSHSHSHDDSTISNHQHGYLTAFTSFFQQEQEKENQKHLSIYKTLDEHIPSVIYQSKPIVFSEILQCEWLLTTTFYRVDIGVVTPPPQIHLFT
ncbi:hypothetical protein [Joostella sp. CR20]|uniref:hypothetical protein n=1 Tax=Joostella sp. CR20 TaxID=2804312 RepID=UPI00313E2272